MPRKKGRVAARRVNKPIDSVLVDNSSLKQYVGSGITKVALDHKSKIDQGIKSQFSESIELDEALRTDFPNDHRWDYLLGHSVGNVVVGLEIHSATNGEVAVLIAKRKSAINQLATHVRPGRSVAKWIWVASGKTGFSPIDKHVLRLNQSGIVYAGSKLLAKHLG